MRGVKDLPIAYVPDPTKGLFDSSDITSSVVRRQSHDVLHDKGTWAKRLDAGYERKEQIVSRIVYVARPMRPEARKSLTWGTADDDTKFPTLQVKSLAHALPIDAPNILTQCKSIVVIRSKRGHGVATNVNPKDYPIVTINSVLKPL